MDSYLSRFEVKNQTVDCDNMVLKIDKCLILGYYYCRSVLDLNSVYHKMQSCGSRRNRVTNSGNCCFWGL